MESLLPRPCTACSRVAGLLTLAILTLAPDVAGQSGATLRGRVFDSSDASIPGAVVRLISRSTQEIRSWQADQTGKYEIASLTPGVYRAEVESPGFQMQVIETLELEVLTIIVRDFTLSVGGQNEKVVVT